MDFKHFVNPEESIPDECLPASRLVPINVSFPLEEGLQAKTKDALWFLTRQWQRGEFRGTYGGHPVNACARAQFADLDEISVSPDDESSFRPIPCEHPLEAIIEHEDKAPGGAAKPEAWDPQSLEYRFALRGGTIVLEAREYDGGQLDWYDFNAVTVSTQGAALEEHIGRPTALAFRGMPSARWWTFEDADADFSGFVRSGSNILATLLTEFLLFPPGWFVLPIEQRFGTVRVVHKLSITDSFGTTRTIVPIANTPADEHGWSVYTLHLRPSAGDLDHVVETTLFDAQLLLLPNTAARPLEGDPIERVTFARDELANLVWAIEHTYCKREDTTSTVIDRDNEEALKRAKELAQTELGEESSTVHTPQYRLRSYVPQNWIPYVARVEIPSGAQERVVLRRGRTDAEAGKTRPPQYSGQLIQESWKLRGDAVPVNPIELSKRYRVVIPGPQKWTLTGAETKEWRTQAGPRTVIAWLARQKRPGKQYASSKLRFDYTEPS